jgi:hypothetical protein
MKDITWEVILQVNVAQIVKYLVGAYVATIVLVAAYLSGDFSTALEVLKFFL